MRLDVKVENLGDLVKDLQRLSEVFDIVKASYFEPVDEKKVEEMEAEIQRIIDEQVKAGISVDPGQVEDDDEVDLDDLSFDDEDDDK